MVVYFKVILQMPYYYENNVKYQYQVDVFSKKLYTYFGIESLFEDVLLWYMYSSTVKNPPQNL